MFSSVSVSVKGSSPLFDDFKVADPNVDNGPCDAVGVDFFCDCEVARGAVDFEDAVYARALEPTLLMTFSRSASASSFTEQ